MSLPRIGRIHIVFFLFRMATPAYTVTCTKKALIAPGVYEVRFSKPEGFSFKAGQFVLFDVALKDNPADIQTRAYSLASSPAESDLVFVVKLKSGGRGSVWIEELLSVGSTVRMQGPFGLFLLKEAEPAYVLVATGAGIAPFRSQAKWLLEEKGDTRPLTVLFGVREPADFFWLDTFEDLAKRFPHFTFMPTLSGTDSSWTGLRGRVLAHLPSALTSGSGVYICGAPEMVKDVKDACLGALGLSKIQVHAEGYI